MAKLHEDYLRSILFGAEDSLVSTAGIVIGVAVATGDNRLTLMAGIIAICVEALSMGAGQYLSERGVHQFDPTHTDSLKVGAGLMFTSYFLAGLLPLAPFFLVPYPLSMYLCIGFSLFGLYMLGHLKGLAVKVSPIRSGLEMFFIGGLAAVVGIAVGFLTKSL